MSISIAQGKGCMWVVDVIKAAETKCIFLESLLGATMQNGSIREKELQDYWGLSHHNIILGICHILCLNAYSAKYVDIVSIVNVMNSINSNQKSRKELAFVLLNG